MASSIFRDGEGLRLQQILQAIVDWLPPLLVAVEDRLSAGVARDGRVRLGTL
jgi:hypothetical protein